MNLENLRREMAKMINENPTGREALTAKYGKVWTTEEATADFDFIGFSSPYAIVRRKSDTVKGCLTFQHSPRFYFSFQPEYEHI